MAGVSQKVEEKSRQRTGRMRTGHALMATLSDDRTALPGAVRRTASIAQ
jgi:hypothetical protein